MLLNQKAFKLINAASTDPTRPNIAGVYLDEDGSAIATDGHMLVRFVDPCPTDPKDYPVMEGCDPTSDGKLKPVLIPRDTCQQILRAIPKKTTMPVLQTVALDVEKTNETGAPVLGINDLSSQQVFRPRKEDYGYPEYKKVVPTNKAKAEIGLAINLLERFCKTMKALDVRYVKFEIREPTEAITFEATTSNGEKVNGAIMPCRI